MSYFKSSSQSYRPQIQDEATGLPYSEANNRSALIDDVKHENMPERAAATSLAYPSPSRHANPYETLTIDRRLPQLNEALSRSHCGCACVTRSGQVEGDLERSAGVLRRSGCPSWSAFDADYTHDSITGDEVNGDEGAAEHTIEIGDFGLVSFRDIYSALAKPSRCTCHGDILPDVYDHPFAGANSLESSGVLSTASRLSSFSTIPEALAWYGMRCCCLSSKLNDHLFVIDGLLGNATGGLFTKSRHVETSESLRPMRPPLSALDADTFCKTVELHTDTSDCGHIHEHRYRIHMWHEDSARTSCQRRISQGSTPLGGEHWKKHDKAWFSRASCNMTLFARKDWIPDRLHQRMRKPTILLSTVLLNIVISSYALQPNGNIDEAIDDSFGAHHLMPQALRSQTAFFYSLVASAMLLRVLGHLNREDQYQHWFAGASIPLWLILGLALRLPLVTSSVCVLPWAAHICLLLSDLIHRMRGAASRVPAVGNLPGLEKSLG